MGGATFIEEVGKGFVTESAKSLLGKVTSLLSEQIVLAWGFKDNLKDFQEMFNIIQFMVVNANEGNISNPVLEGWLNKVRAFIFEAEDVVDEYFYQMLRRKVIAAGYHHPSPTRTQSRILSRLSELRIKTKVRLALFKSVSSNPVVVRIRMANKLKYLRKTWDEIIDQANKHGIKAVEVAAADPYYQEPETLRNKRREVDFSNVVGRSTEMDTIINLLRHASESSQCLSVIGIYGAAGLGKTTLCRAAFENEQVKRMFNHHIWICVSHTFQLDTILNEMAAQLKLDITSSREAMKQGLQHKLKDQKYLLVLDDAWITFADEWESLKNVLTYLKGSNGTTLLVTSRSEELLKKLLVIDAEGMKEPLTYELGTLKKEKSEELFWERVGHEESSDPVKKEVAQTLLKRCNGVPLAIRTLGGMLRSRKRAQDWVAIEKSEIWSENDDVYPSVKLSFMYLSSAALKRCFAFCGIFKEDQIIDKDELIQLWMANGLLRSSDDDKMEQVGEQYFDELLRNSLFQEPSFDGYEPFEKVVGCKMHDVVHKLATDILKQESSCSSSQQAQYYLSQRVFYDDDEVSLEQGGNKLRLLVLFGRCERLDNKVRLLDFKCLRALSLVDLRLKELPDSIGILKHMRYLDISGNRDLRSLPDGLTKLHHLQTLRMLYFVNGVPRFPREINKLINLRHLYTGSFGTMGIPKGLGMLSRLQTLPPLNLIEHWGGSLRELKSLNQLKGLITLKGLEEANEEEARKANLGSKQNIEHLHLIWNPSDEGERGEDRRVVDALQPHPNLRGLNIEYYMAKTLPDWIMTVASNSHSLSTLIKLWITDCKYITCLPDVRGLTCLESLDFSRCENVSRLEQLAPIYDLPRLRDLWLGEFSRELDTVFPPLQHPHYLNSPLSKTLRQLWLYGDGMDKVKSLPPQIQYFIALEDFRLERFPSVEEIPDWLCNLTSLKTLELDKMPSLKHLPSADAMQQLTSLTTLRIYYCPILAEECQTKIGPQWPKIQHIDVRII